MPEASHSFANCDQSFWIFSLVGLVGMERLRLDAVADGVAHPLVDGLRRPPVLARDVPRARHQLVRALIPDGVDGIAGRGPRAQPPARWSRPRTGTRSRARGRAAAGRTRPAPLEAGQETGELEHGLEALARHQAGLAAARAGLGAVRVDHVLLRLDLLVGAAELDRAPVRSDDALLGRCDPRRSSPEPARR